MRGSMQAMTCPACGRDLSHLDAGSGLFLDVCDGGCGGIWFDNHELQQFDEAAERQASPVFDVTGDAPATIAGKRSCPRCAGQKLRRHWYSVARQVEVDECPSCGGNWLDAGELQKIRAEFADADAREDAAKAAYDQLFGQQLAEMRQESQETVARADRFAQVFWILSPSRWFK